MLDYGILIAFALCVLLIGFVFGRVSVTLPELFPGFDHISDTAVARISYEARRAYEQSLGVMTKRSWNNLSDAQREAYTQQAATRRERGGIAHAIAGALR